MLSSSIKTQTGWLHHWHMVGSVQQAARTWTCLNCPHPEDLPLGDCCHQYRLRSHLTTGNVGTSADAGRQLEGDEQEDTAAARPVGQTEEQKRVEAVAKRGAAAMLFLELLFWKPAALAAEIRDEYNWRVGKASGPLCHTKFCQQSVMPNRTCSLQGSQYPTDA